MIVPVAVETLGQDTVLLHFGQGLDAAVNARVHDALAVIRAAALPGIVELVPAFASLAVQFDANAWSGGEERPSIQLLRALEGLMEQPVPVNAAAAAALEIPVCYDGDCAPDLAEVARRLQLSQDEVVQRHSVASYRVAMLGFSPGFPYLLGLDPRLQLPRRDTPRTRVPAGSVAIGGAQSGIYPRELPGGWHLMGRTPLNLFDLRRTPPNRITVGAQVRFRRIAADEFAALARDGA